MENSVTIADLVLVQFEAPSEVSFSENNIVYLKKKKKLMFWTKVLVN